MMGGAERVSPAGTADRRIRRLLVGVRGHGGEEVYSALLRDHPPAGVSGSATLDFHSSCLDARCRRLREIALNRLVHPLASFNMGFRVLDVGGDVDLVHVHTHPVVLRNLSRRPVVFSAGSSHYHYIRDYEGWNEDRIEKAYARARALYRRAGVLDALLNHEGITLAYTFSRSAREVYLARGVPAWKIRTLYPGFPVRTIERRKKGPGVTYLFLGRSPRRKGGPLVLDAFRRVRATLPDARLIYASDEPPDTPIEGLELSPLVPASEVHSLYSRADVLVNPTLAEGFGFTNAEAQGYGLSVVTSRLGAIPEVVENGKTGFLIEPGELEGLVAAMIELGRNSELRAAFSSAAKRCFAERFSLSAMQAGLGELYDEAIDRSRTRQ